jgi:uncharacterized surface protein with fasciclin (FAS1) repeats
METIVNILKAAMAGVKGDTRVRYGLGAGASVLLSAGVLGMGGTIVPTFLHASGVAPQTYSQTSQAPAGVEVIDMSTSTVAEIIEAMPKAARFELMLYNSGLTELLHQAGVITVFVPASAQFDYLPKRYIAGLSRRQMSELALGHIVERALPMQESLNGTVITAAHTALAFAVDASAQEITIGGARVLKAYKAKNGYVYLINQVLIDPDLANF